MSGKSLAVVVLGIGVIGLVSIGARAGQAKDDHAGNDRIPPAARAALEKLAGDAKISKISVEREHGALVYEAEWVKDGREFEAEVTADGELLELEEELSVRDLPPAVRTAVLARFPGKSKIEVEKKTIVVYEIEGKIGGEEKELIVFPTGAIHEDEHGHDAQKGEHEDEDDEEDDDDD